MVTFEKNNGVVFVVASFLCLCMKVKFLLLVSQFGPDEGLREPLNCRYRQVEKGDLLCVPLDDLMFL